MESNRHDRPRRPPSDAETTVARSTRQRLLEWLDALTEEAYAGALYEWARSEDGPMPTWADSRCDAEDEARLLLEGLSDWGAIDPALLDVQEKAAMQARRRGNARNAHLREHRGPDWWDFL